MKFKLQILFFLLVSFLLSTCNFNKYKGWKEIKTSEYIISYPAEWKVHYSRPKGMEFMLVPVDSSNNESLINSISLSSRKALTSKIDLKQFGIIEERELQNNIPDIYIIESGIKKENKEDYYYLLHFKAEIGFSMEYITRLYLKNEKSYALSFRSMASTFPMYEAKASEILNSFVLK